MVYLMWMVMELPSAKQQAQKMLQGAARGELGEERELSEPPWPAERLMIVTGAVTIVPLQMSDLPLYARFAINVDENLGCPFEILVAAAGGRCT